MVILVDTNIIIDALANREPYADDAKRIMEKCAAREITGILAAHSIPNLFYILRKNFSQEELAKKMHISRQSISKWETGKSLPTTDQIILLSEIFDCSLDTLLKGDKKMEEKAKHEIDDKRTLKLIYKVG